MKERQRAQEESVPTFEAYRERSKERKKAGKKSTDHISVTISRGLNKWVTLLLRSDFHIPSQQHSHQTNQTTPVNSQGTRIKIQFHF